MGGTFMAELDRWTHQMHKSGKDKTGAGRWSWFTVIGKNNTKMIYIPCYRVYNHPPIHLIGSAYYQQYHIMEQEKESRLLPLYPHQQTIQDLQIFMRRHLQDGYTVNLTIYGNKSDAHLFLPPTYNSHITTPLGFKYDSRISGSIAAMLEACDLVNIHRLHHGVAPSTHTQGSHQIDFMFI
jgi:hypothetical protein